MPPNDDKQHTPPPKAKPIDGGFMLGQVQIMRRENPEIWERIDAMCDGHFDASAFKRHLFVERTDCETCGYNLFGNTSGVCPECGTPMHTTPEARRMISIRIFDMLRTAQPDKWNDVSERMERERMARVKEELQAEGARRDEIRRSALKNWLKRKRGDSDDASEPPGRSGGIDAEHD